MTFGLWNRKAPRDESKPPAATVSKSKWTSLKAKLSPRRDQQHLDTKPSVNTKDSPKDEPREPRSGAPSSFVPAAPAPAPAPRSAGWPSRLRVKTGLGLHLRGKLSFKTEKKKPSSSRPPSLESCPEWDPEFYASTMEAERRAVAERKNAAVTARELEPWRAELFNGPPGAVLRPLSPPMTQHSGDVIDGADATSARSSVPPGTPELLDASNSMVNLPKGVRSGHSGDGQTSPMSLQPVPSISSVKAATPRATAGPPNPLPIITVEEATLKSSRTRTTKCIYRPPVSALEFKPYRYSIAKSQGIAVKEEEPESGSDRPESPEVFLPPLPPPLPRNPSNVVEGAETTSVHSPVRLRTRGTSNVSPRPSIGKTEQAPPTSSQTGSSGRIRLPPLPASEPKPGNVCRTSPTPETKPGSPLQHESTPELVDASNSMVDLPKEVRSGHSSDRQTSPRSLQPSSSSPRPANPIPIITVEEATPKSLRTRATKCIYRPPVSALVFKPYRYSIAKGQEIAVKEEEPGSASDLPESPEVLLPPLPPRLPRNPCNVVEGAETTSVHPPVPLRTRGTSNVSPRPSIGKTEQAQPTGLQTGSSGRIRLPPLPASESKSDKVCTTSPTPETKPAPPNRQVGLSVKVIWARQLRYRLDFSHSIGDRRLYAAAAQEALAAGYVICPNHVLRRASAILTIDLALLPNNPADL